MSRIVTVVVALVIAAIAAFAAWHFFPLNDYATSKHNLFRFVALFAVVLVGVAIVADIAKDELQHWSHVRFNRRVAARS